MGTHVMKSAHRMVWLVEAQDGTILDLVVREDFYCEVTLDLRPKGWTGIHVTGMGMAVLGRRKRKHRGLWNRKKQAWSMQGPNRRPPWLVCNGRSAQDEICARSQGRTRSHRVWCATLRRQVLFKSKWSFWSRKVIWFALWKRLLCYRVENES